MPGYLLRESDKENGVYRIEVYCTNCGYSGEATIQLGVPVKTALSTLPCPRCECTELERLT